jgi:hypothetical protein
METAKTPDRTTSIEGIKNCNASEAIYRVCQTQELQHSTSDEAATEACPATPSEGTTLLAPGTCAQPSASPMPVQGGCTVMPPPAISPAAMMTPDADKTYTHVSTHLVFNELLRNNHYHFTAMLHIILVVIRVEELLFHIRFLKSEQKC